MQTRIHEGVIVVRDDLYPGGTKARYIRPFIKRSEFKEFIYASPAEGGAQTSLAYVCRELGRRATIFVAQRAVPHPRAVLAKRLGAKVVQVPHGYLNVVQAAAKRYAEARKDRCLLPFGMDIPGASEMIAKYARGLNLKPDEVWCCAGSGTLARGLALTWPKARLRVVQIGRTLTKKEVSGAKIYIYPRPFGAHAKEEAPFPSDFHYDSKAWEFCMKHKSKKGDVVFFNVMQPADAA